MKNKRVILAIVLPCVLSVLLLTLDLVSKHLIDKSLGTVGASKEIINGFISFIYVHNSGAAWGILSDRPVFLIIISIIVIALFIAFYVLRLRKFKDKISLWLSVSLGFIAGGCFGNLIDRIAFGYVRDFINFDFMNFPVFNVADICLTVGIILLFIYFIFFYSKEEKLLKTESASAIFSSPNSHKSSEEDLQKSSNKKEESAINEKQNLEEDTSKVGDISEQNQNQDQIQNENRAEDISTDDKIDSDKNAK